MDFCAAIAFAFALPFTTAALLHLLCPDEAGKRRPRLKAAIWIVASAFVWTGALIMTGGVCLLEVGLVLQIALLLQVMVASVFWAVARGAYEVLVRPLLPRRRRAARKGGR